MCLKYNLIPDVQDSFSTTTQFLCDDTKMTPEMIRKLKLIGVVPKKSQNLNLREAILYTSHYRTSIASSYTKCTTYTLVNIFRFMLDVVGFGDMFLVEPVIYKRYSYRSSFSHSNEGFYGFLGESKKYKRLCKNPTVRYGIEQKIKERTGG